MLRQRGENMKHPACVGMKDSVRIRSIFGAAIIALMLCTSCEVLFTDKFWGTRPVYSHDTPPSYAYQLLLKEVSDQRRLYPEGKYLYLLEYENGGRFCLIKFDMETGAYQ